MSLRYDDQTVVITGVGHGLGSLYAKHFASLGANLIVHDNVHKSLVDRLAQEIRGAGGKAMSDYSIPQDGGNIVEAAIASFGRIDIIICNAMPQSDPSWTELQDWDWDSLLEQSFKLIYKCVHAAWPYFKKQKFGRVITTASIGAYEKQVDTALQSAAKFGEFGFTQTIAKEGAKYNILACTLATPSVGSSSGVTMHDTIDGALRSLAVLSHSSNHHESGHLYHVEGKRCRKLRWQRAGGAWQNPDNGLTPGSIQSKWADVNDFAKGSYPTSSSDFKAVLTETKQLSPGDFGKDISFKGKVVLVSGAGAGLGRAYALQFSKLGAKVVLNDLKDPSSVATEIRSAGGAAHTVIHSATQGQRIIAETIDAFGRIDVVVNNAGFVRDKTIANMTDPLWDSILDVHLRGTYSITKAAWPYFVSQGYGRVLNITSTSGIYGNFGQSNYALAKCAIIGLTNALAREGAAHNIKVNAVAPVASTAALADALQGSSREILPQYSAPFVALLCSDNVPYPSTGGLYEIGGGWHARTRLEANAGTEWQANKLADDQLVTQNLNALANFELNFSYPEDYENNLRHLSDQVHRRGTLGRIESAKIAQASGSKFEYTQRDAILYNLTLGAGWTETSLVYENDKNFQVLPTFGAIPWFGATLPFTYHEILPEWNPLKLLHGEIYLEIRKYPIPTTGKLVTVPRLLHVLDKSKAAVVTTAYSTRYMDTGEELFYNESSAYIRDAGNFGGPSEAPASAPASRPPSRKPDFVREEKTTEGQAALYRLNGDTNDLHIDPSVAHRSGFARPILHGLCFFGISGKHVYQQYGPYKNIHVRFAGTVLPGQSLRTEAWLGGQSNDIVIFQTRVLETGKLCITGGRVELIRSSNRSRL